MREGIHPEYHLVKVTCSCGNQFEVGSTLKKDVLNIEVCDKCHPFYTRQQKIIDTTGRIDKYKSRYDRQKPVAGAATKSEIDAKVKEAVAKNKAAVAKKTATAKPKAKPAASAAKAPAKKVASEKAVAPTKEVKTTKTTKETKEKK